MSLDRDFGSYVSLRTYKRDGRAVDTPVWFAERHRKLYVFTEGDSFKVKRLRRNPRVQVARCGAFGRVTGVWHDGTARVVADARTEAAAYEALRAKYGWQMRLIDLLSRLAGRMKGRVILEIDVAAA
jgi:PPOX class probable F420-dependent enzyme